MNALLRIGLLSCCVVQLAASRLPPGFRPALSGTRHEIAGYSVEVPGKGWLENKTGQAVVFGKRVDGTESYHAGMNVIVVPAVQSKAELLAFVQKRTTTQSGNPRFKVVRNEVIDTDVHGLWAVLSRVDFEDSGAVNVKDRDTLATHGAQLFVVDPRAPESLITLTFSRRAAEFDDARFSAEAKRFFDSFRRAGP